MLEKGIVLWKRFLKKKRGKLEYEERANGSD